MAILFQCTGRKKPFKNMLAFSEEFAKKKEISIIATTQKTKKVAFWKYEELKILFLNHKTGKIRIEEKLLKDVDYAAMEARSKVPVKMSSFQVEDDWLKCNIMTLTGGFQLNGGQIQIQEEVEHQGEYRKKKRQCHFVMAGPNQLIVNYKDKLLQEKIVDPKTVEYIL